MPWFFLCMYPDQEQIRIDMWPDVSEYALERETFVIHTSGRK